MYITNSMDCCGSALVWITIHVFMYYCISSIRRRPRIVAALK